MCLQITLTCVYRNVSVSYDQLHPKVVNYGINDCKIGSK